jgi:hypothetical protein
MNKQHKEKNKMNKEEYINWISSPRFWGQISCERLADFSGYINEHLELKVRDFIEIAARGNYPEFLNIVFDKFGASSFTPEDGGVLILFKGYQAPVVADIAIERGLSLEALKEYKTQLGNELSYKYNFDNGNLTIAYAKISDAITNTQKGQTMNNTNNEQQEKIYTNKDAFTGFTLGAVLGFVPETEKIHNWLEKPFLPDWVKKGTRFKYGGGDRVYEIDDIQTLGKFVRCCCGTEFGFMYFVAPIGKVPECVQVKGEKDSEEMPEWADAGHWVFDKVKKQVRYVDSTSLSLSTRGNVALGFFDGMGWAGTIEELKRQFSPSDVKINK